MGFGVATGAIRTWVHTKNAREVEERTFCHRHKL